MFSLLEQKIILVMLVRKYRIKCIKPLSFFLFPLVFPCSFLSFFLPPLSFSFSLSIYSRSGRQNGYNLHPSFNTCWLGSESLTSPPNIIFHCIYFFSNKNSHHGFFFCVGQREITRKERSVNSFHHPSISYGRVFTFSFLFCKPFYHFQMVSISFSLFY